MGRWCNVTQNNRAWGRSMCGGLFARGARSFLPGFPRSILRLCFVRVWMRRVQWEWNAALS